LVNEDGFAAGRVPVAPFEKDCIATTLALTLKPDGAAAFSGSRAYRGLRGAYRDNFTNPEDRENNVELALSALFSGATVAAYDFDHLDDRGGDFALNFAGRAPSYAKERGGGRLAWVVAPYRFNLAQAYISGEKRVYPIRLERPEAWTDTVAVTLPEGYEVASLPAGRKLVGPHADYALDAALDGNVVTVNRHLYVAQGDIAPGDYGKLVKFCRDVDKLEKEEVVIAPAGRP
jgi:hypothetical protein